MAPRKVVLFSPPYNGPVLGPPVGLPSLAGSLREAGYTPCIIDGALDRDYLTTIAREIESAACFGVSLLTGPMIREAVEASRLVRKVAPKLPIVFGGWHPSLLTAQTLREEFVDVVRKMAGIAKRYDITIAMENLNRGETNFGNSLAEVVGLVREVNHPRFRATADIYHMLREEEPPGSIVQAGKYLVHCHIAENRDRARPGKNGEDFRPYFKAMWSIGYKGLIMMECGWTDPATEAGPALAYLQGQLDEAYR